MITDRCKDVVYSSRVRFARNITGLPFPEKLTGEEEIYSVLMRGVEKALAPLGEFRMYRMNGLDPLDTFFFSWATTASSVASPSSALPSPPDWPLSRSLSG